MPFYSKLYTTLQLMSFFLKLVRTIEHSYNSQFNNNEEIETETAMLGLVNEYIEDEEIACLLYTSDAADE